MQAEEGLSWLNKADINHRKIMRPSGTPFAHIMRQEYLGIGLLEANGGPAVLNVAIGGFTPIGMPVSVSS